MKHMAYFNYSNRTFPPLLRKTMKNKVRINGVHIEIRNGNLLITADFVTSVLTSIIKDWHITGMFPFQTSVDIPCLVLCVGESLEYAEKGILLCPILSLNSRITPFRINRLMFKFVYM
jgi:hypothetical protein